MNTKTTPVLTIDVVSDVVCPWCYIGKRHLEDALSQWREASDDAKNVDVVVRWHPFQLNPDLPRDGIDRQSYLEEKFGGKTRAAEIYARVGAAGKDAGLALNFDGIERQPNTLAAHALIAYAQHADAAKVDTLIERLFRAYFVDGVFIGDVDALLALATECGYDAEAARVVVTDPSALEQIAAQDASIRAQGISGVPFFIFNNQLTLSGAQPAAVIRQAIEQSL
jgi:predicted DsbA family dithiol-disulfide isomerase